MQAKKVALVLGPLIFFIIVQGPFFTDLSTAARYVLATTVWMAIWWVFEAVPIAVTALLPLLLFPASESLSIKATAASYAHPIIFLFIGGFMIATAIQKWKLHQRIALHVIHRLGTKPDAILLGFMLATAFLSMWISNTATTIMMVPIALAMMQSFSQDHPNNAQFSKALLLGIAYAASIGGIATLIGTPTNLIFTAMVEERYGWEISFAQWLFFAFPIAALLLFITWFYLSRRIQKNKQIREGFGLDANYVKNKIIELGPMRYEEKVVLFVFALVAFSWMTRTLLINPFFPGISDTVIAITGAILLFVLPTRLSSPNALNSTDQQQRILDWATAVQIPWDVILLFGGGLSLAFAFNDSGLALWLGQKFLLLNGLPFFLLLLILIFLVNFLTEITSNVATVSMVLPILAALSESLGLHPYLLLIGATCAASCAFMLPTATAPNAIVFGANTLAMKDMIKAGLGLNLLSILLLSFYIYFLMPIIFGIDHNTLPVLGQ